MEHTYIVYKGRKNVNAHKIRMLNVFSNEEIVFSSNTECIEYLRSIGLDIHERLVLSRIHFSKKYTVQPVVDGKFIFAPGDEPFPIYSFC